MRRFLMSCFILIAVAIALGIAAFFAEQWSFFAPGPPARRGQATVVLIKPDERSAAIAQQLQEAGVIRNAALFRLGVQLRGKNAALRAGEYAFKSGSSMADTMGVLIAGKSIQHKLTVAEGLTSQMIHNAMNRDPLLTGSAGAAPEEGALLPETYYYTRGTARAAILARMARAQRRLLAGLWPRRKPDLPFQSPEQAVTLASIVEKETALPEERRHIAAVFLNRLRLGMKLQSDPTVIYGISKGYPLGRGIRESELAAPTPYNTYVIGGLPPAPICNPGKDSIQAVLQPEESNDLYFVANGTGGHVFTASLAEHERNVAKWRAIERSREPGANASPAAAQLAAAAPLRGSADAKPPPKRAAVLPHRRRRKRHGQRSGF